MPTWIVQHAVTNKTVDEHGTKKAAAAQAKEMTDAHTAIDAKHEGVPVTFVAVKLETSPAEDESATETGGD